MAKKRMIHDCIWRSEGVGMLTMSQRLLWIGLITTADDQGRGLAHPGLIRAAVFPFDIISLEDIKADLLALHKADFIIIYQVENKECYQVVNWWEYQKPQWAGPSDYKAPDGWADRMRYHGKGHKIISVNWGVNNKGSKPPSKPPSKPALLKEEGKGKGKEKDNTGALFSELTTEWARLFKGKPQPRTLGSKNKAHLKRRMADKNFVENWRTALVKASRSKFLNDNGFFTLWWFIANDDNWQKCYDGNYDDEGGSGGGIKVWEAR